MVANVRNKIDSKSKYHATIRTLPKNSYFLFIFFVKLLSKLKRTPGVGALSRTTVVVNSGCHYHTWRLVECSHKGRQAARRMFQHAMLHWRRGIVETRRYASLLIGQLWTRLPIMQFVRNRIQTSRCAVVFKNIFKNWQNSCTDRPKVRHIYTSIYIHR